MSTLNLETVDLTARERGSPKNGAPSSADYNDLTREILADMVSIVGFLNQQVSPILNALPAAAGSGLEGKTLFADSTNNTSLFWDSGNNRSYTVAEVCQNLFNSLAEMDSRIKDLKGRVAELRQLLSTTGQSDLLASISSFTDQIRNLTTTIVTLKQTQAVYESRLAKIQTVRVEASTVIANGTVTQNVYWNNPYPADNNYTAFVSVEDEDAALTVLGWKRITGGIGIEVVLHNPTASPVSDAIIHMIGQYDGDAA